MKILEANRLRIKRIRNATVITCAFGVFWTNWLSAAGSYQQTADGHALVWNNYPKPDDQVMWSGQVDGNGYASGSGTVMWYKGTAFVTQYSGTMVKGKLSGLVTNEDANGNTFSGTYVNGQKKTWVQTGGSSTRNSGGYQKTADDRPAFVWNNYPKKGDQASWSGNVDLEGYATGQGQLDWFKNGHIQTSYVGTMVRGKWQGVVINQDPDGTKFEGVWADGIKTSDWGQVAEFRRTNEPSPEQKELNSHWSAYLKEIQEDQDYENWAALPYDAYAKRQ